MPDRLPEWEPGTPAVLCVAGPHAIPVSTYVRAGEHRILVALGCRRETLARLREDPRAAFCLLGAGVAFTAYGEGAILRESLDVAPTNVAVELRIQRVQDHLADGRTEILDGAKWEWRTGDAAQAAPAIIAELRSIA